MALASLTGSLAMWLNTNSIPVLHPLRWGWYCQEEDINPVNICLVFGHAQFWSWAILLAYEVIYEFHHKSPLIVNYQVCFEGFTMNTKIYPPSNPKLSIFQSRMTWIFSVNNQEVNTKDGPITGEIPNIQVYKSPPRRWDTGQISYWKKFS
jgi:hypothetical protein